MSCFYTEESVQLFRYSSGNLNLLWIFGERNLFLNVAFAQIVAKTSKK